MKSNFTKPPASFEAALQELEAIVQSLEGGAAPIETSLAAYERGVALLNFCQDTLGQAEQKIRILDGDRLRNCATSETDAGTNGR